MLLHKCWLTGPGPGLYDVKEVGYVDEDIGFLVDDDIYRFEEIIIHLFFAVVHPVIGIEEVERGRGWR
jgi:hypothetical protein